MKNQWATKKPDFKEECLVICATQFRGWWEYRTFQVKIIEFNGSSYLGITDGEGEEWGDISDIKADKYFVMDLLKTEPFKDTLSQNRK